MEAIIEVAKYVGNSVFSFVDCHRKLEEDMNDLRSEFQVLKRRKIDVNSRIQAEVNWGQLVKEEVRGWLQDVQKIDDDLQVVEERVHRASYFSRARLAKLVREKIEVVKRIQQRGSFFEGLSVDRAPTPGIIIPTENLEDEISNKEKIWECLMRDDVGMIGVYGIGGVGKTTIMKHVNNDLLKETKFHKVAWVTVSYPLNVFELQKNIAHAIGQKLPEDIEEMRQAATLMDIMGKMRFVLILDDVWEKFSLKDVGIPEPTMPNGCKVVITSRSAEICNYMGCKIVKVQPLSLEKSLNLFLNKVGRDVLQVPKLEEIVKLIVEKCAGLPLAIVVIAGSMRGEYGINVWRNALIELGERVQSVNGSDNEIFERLRFSYDRLNSSEIQKCFLYCSLFPEDFLFSKNSLIEGWIDEGLISELGSRQAAYDRGLAFLNKLEKNCMLEKTVNCYGNEVVKLHDVVRDMAIKSIGPGLGYMARAGTKLRKVPDELEWVKDLNKVSLMQNEISRIPLGLSPKCSTLSTLILSNNLLSKIPDSFFKDMNGLKVLDLSWTNIEALPDSISNLQNLIALRLQSCKRLKHVPSLAKLSTLKKLDLHDAGIGLVPKGMDMLTSLTYLDLFCPHLKQIPTGILSNLSCLQHLVIYYGESNALKIKGEEVARLSNLETLDGGFDNLQDFNYFVKSKAFQSLTAYMLVVGTDKDLISINFPMRSQCVLLISHCEIGGEWIVLPSNLQGLRICGCKNLRTLNKIALLEKETKLSFCGIRYCEEIECMLDVVSSSSVCCLLLEKLESLDLYLLPSLHVLVRMEGVPTPPHIFSNLKMLFMRRCSRMRKLFPLELLPALQNLEKIEVGDCECMEELIASNASVKFTFPKLRELYLSDLPQLMSIYGVEGVMGCDSIEEIEILRCPKLKRIPIQFAVLDNGESSPPPCLTEIRIESYEWWESLKWDDPKAKNLLQPFLRHWQS